ncbi:MAG: CHASE2 domain-containing protein [Phycisphaerales bacterium]|nr:CHASE2 domain-containing protein [Phycisphaerales bacterium]
MKNVRSVAIVVGCIITLITLGLNAVGSFQWIEDWTIDLRFRYVRWQIEDIGEQIALVAIDDASLDTIGRWPWKRSLLAQATEEIARAGAQTIAFDILFTEPEEDSTGDVELAKAMSQSQCVVALTRRLDIVLDPVWETPLGKMQLAAFTNAVEAGIDRDINVIIEQAALVEPYKAQVLARPTALKEVAAWRTLERFRAQGKLPKTFKEYTAVMLGGNERAEHTREFGEEKMLERIWLRGESWRAVEGTLISDATSKGTPQDLPPIGLIAKAVKGVGVVNAMSSKFDGQFRRLSTYFPTDFGIAPQFGLAAALVFQHQTVNDAVAHENYLQLRNCSIPIRDGKLLLNWPTKLLAGYGNGTDSKAAIGMGRVIGQSIERKKLERQEERLQLLGEEISIGVLGRKSKEWFQSASRDGRLKKEILDTWKSDYEEHVNDPDLDPRLKQAGDGLREWMIAEKAFQDGKAILNAGDIKLRETLGGKLVFVGFTATGVMADMISTIFDARTPGIFASIIVADMVLNGRSLEFAPDWVGPMAIILLGLISTLTGARFGAGIAAIVVFFVLAFYIGVLGVIGFDWGNWICPMAAPVSSGIGAWIVTTVIVAVITQREKQRVTRQFRARVSPQLVEMLSKNPKVLSMGGVEREATILFGDLAGFTAINAILGGPAVVSTLNLYMSAMTKELISRRAYVNKFLGDGILAFWSAFGEEPEQGRLSIEAALACQKIVTEIGKRPDRQGLPIISLRLGMATGKVVIGDCGAPPDLNDYTMIGDSGNLAARLESANKQFGSAILIDGRTAELSKESGLALLSLGRVVVVGQTIPIDLYEVCLEDDPTARIEATEAMVRLFTACQFDECRASLANLLKTLPGSKKLVHAFMDALDNPEDLRDGVLRLRAK